MLEAPAAAAAPSPLLPATPRLACSRSCVFCSAIGSGLQSRLESAALSPTTSLASPDSSTEMRCSCRGEWEWQQRCGGGSAHGSLTPLPQLAGISWAAAHLVVLVAKGLGRPPQRIQAACGGS